MKRCTRHDEKTKKWHGPYRVTKVFEKAVWIERHDGIKKYSVDHCIPVKEATGMHLINHLQCALSRFATMDAKEPENILLTEVLPPGDERRHSPEFAEAIEKELRGLVANEVYKVVPRESVPKDANILGGRFRSRYQE